MGILSADLRETLDFVVRLAFTENTDKPLRINIRQCQLLANKASETLLKLKEFDEFLEHQELNNLEHASTTLVPNLTPAVTELHRVLKNAEMLIEDCCCGDHWLEKAIYQGNLKKTFAKILYEIEWHLSVLCSFLMIKGGDFEKMQNFDGELRYIEYFTLEAAAKYDLTSLRRLREDHVCDRQLICKSDCLAIKLLNKLDAEEAGMMDKRNPLESNSPLFLWVKPADIPDRSGHVLGNGSFAEVKVTKWLGHTCAWKEFKSGRGWFDLFKSELAAMAGLDHPNIVHVVCCTEDDFELGIIMERMNKSLGALLQSIHKEFRRKGNYITHGTHASPFSIPKSVELMLQIAEGLRYIHSKGMAHRDLNPQNILLQYADPPPSSPAIVGAFSVLENTTIVAKIADFGLTKMKNDSTGYGTHTLNTGTRRWMAPEIWKFADMLEEPAPSDRFYPKKMDVFSFGIICSGILTGEEPYQVLPKEIYKQMKEGVRPDLPSRTPAMLAALVKKCWDENPRRRPEFSAICTELRFIKALLLRGDDLTRQVSKINTGPGSTTDWIQVHGPWASLDGGNPFSDGVQISSIKQIKVWYNTPKTTIHCIEIEYGLKKKVSHGSQGSGNSEYPAMMAKIEIDEPSEYVTQIEGTFGIGTYGITSMWPFGVNHPVTCVTSLTIHTNEKTHGPYGGVLEGAIRFASRPGRIVGFHGKCGAVLDSIGCYTVPVNL
ncbi:hypothetical protein M758_9G090400 [Ceratodon purpureus]|nr:hypothetical protein M758_9G090400 [Ceratodon purpureus]KAG0605823.1 hypothetical protein M758_9G090400 [Ceratodon purpureus]KAG0605824.1 hypothetical protein M758_9G090400 [Ceratodon purpureus]